jgi:hypothetical protein
MLKLWEIFIGYIHCLKDSSSFFDYLGKQIY